MKNRKNPERITKIKPFINKYNWGGTAFPSEKDDWQRFEKNNLTIALNLLYAGKEKIYPAYVSKHNSNREKQVIFSMISNREKRERSKTLATRAKPEGRKTKSDGRQRQWDYLAVKKLPALLRGITLKNNGDFYCRNSSRSFRIKNKFESDKTAYENKDFGNVIMPSEDTKILELNQYHKVPFVIYADLERIIEKIDGCKNNPENSSTTKVSKNILSGFSMSTISSFRSIENKHHVYRGKDCMKKFCEYLRKYAMKKKKNEVINKR